MREGSRISKKAFASAATIYLACIVLVYFSALFLGKTILPTDQYLMSYKPFASAYPVFAPFNHFELDILRFYYFYQQMAHEHLYRPFWVSGIMGGVPLYANTYATYFSTLNWILCLGPVSYTYPLRLMVSQWIAGSSMFLLISYLGVSFFPALISGLAYLFSSLFVSLLLRSWLHSGFAWVPLLLLFTLLYLRQRKAWAGPAAALVLAFSFLDGFFQTSVTILIAWGFFSLAVNEGWKGWRPSLRALVFCGCIFTVAFLLSCVAWFPQLEYFWGDISKGSSRAGGNDFGKNISQRLLSLFFMPLGAFFPQALGTVRTLDLTKLARTHLQDFSLFLGTIPLLAGIAAFSFKKEPVHRAFSLLVILGLFIPIFTFLDRFLYFRFFAVYLVGIAVLAGLGLEQLQPGDSRVRCIAKWGITFWALLAFAALSFRAFLLAKPGFVEERVRGYLALHFGESSTGATHPAWMLSRGEEFIRHWSFRSWDFNVPFLLVGMSLLAWILWEKGRLSRKNFYLYAFFSVLAQSWITVHLWLPFADLSKFPLFPENEISRFLHREDPGQEFRASVNDDAGEAGQVQILPADSNLLYGYSTIEGWDGVLPFTAFNLLRQGNEGLAEMNVKFLITQPAPLLKEPGLNLRQKGEVAIYELESVGARGRLTTSYSIGTKAQAFSGWKRQVSGSATVFLEETPSFPSSDREPKGMVKFESDTGNIVRYIVFTNSPALFVASESFYPGWKAFWQGVERPVWRANGGMRAVELAPGTGILEFRFEPDSYFYGLLVSALALMGWLFWLWTSRRRPG